MQDGEVLTQLKQNTDGLYFMSESDYPFETLNWGQREISDDFLRGQPGEEAGANVEQQSFDDFYQKYAPRHNYGPVLDALRNNLTDLRVYRVGRVNIGVYLVGKSEEGNWLGLSTRSVET
jgi:Nuclease A inhibitor-like protein